MTTDAALRSSTSAVTVAGSTPYPWPWDGRLAGPDTAVLVVVPASGAPPVGAGVVSAVGSLAERVHALGGLVVLVTTSPPGRSLGGGPAGGVTWPDAVASRALRIAAVGIDGFHGSPLDTLLRGARTDRLLLTGAGLETCVHSTMRSANDRGYECLLVTDACAAYDEQLVPQSISMIEMSGGIFGAVATSTAVLDALPAPRSDA